MDNTLQLKIITALQDKLSGPLKNIQGATGESAKALKELRDRLKDLEKTQKNVQQFRELSTSTKQVEKSLNDAQAKAQKLGAELSKVSNPTAQMRREFETAKAAVNKLKTAQQNQSTQLQRLRSDLSNAGVSTKSLSADERKLRSDITQTSESLKNKQAALRKTTEQQERLAAAQKKYQASQDVAAKMAVTGAAGMATGHTMLRPVRSAINAFTPLEDSATQLKVAMMTAGGIVSPKFQEVSDLATKLGDQLPGTTADFQNMMTMLKRQGMSDETILGGLGESAANMGVLLKLHVEQAAEYAAKMQDALQAPESEMLAITDGMQRMFYAGVDAQNILSGFSKVAPALSTMSKSGKDAFQELSPLLAMFDQSGMDGGSAGNALRKVLQRSMSEKRIEDANDMLKDYKTKIKLDFTDGKGEFGGLDNLFKQLTKLEKLTSVQRDAVITSLIGDDAETKQVVTTMMTKGMAGYNEMAEKMKQQASLNDRVKEQLDTLRNVAEAAEGSFTNAMGEIGATVAEDLKGILNWLGELANKVGEFARANPELVGWIMKITAVIGGLLIALGSLSIAIAAIIGPFAMLKYVMAVGSIKAAAGVGVFAKLAGAFKAVGLALVWLGKALLVTTVFAAIVAAIAGVVYLIWENWDWLKEQAGAIWSGITGFFSDGWNTISNIGSSIGSVVSAVAQATWNAIAWGASSLWSGVKSYFTGGWNALTSIVSSVAGTYVAIYQGIWDGITGGVSSLWTGVKSLFSTSISSLTATITSWNPVSAFQTVWSGVTGLFASYAIQFSAFGSNLISGLVNGIKGMAGQAYEAISNVGSGVVGWFKDKLGIRSPSRVFKEMGGFVSMGLAEGIQKAAKLAVKATKALAAGVVTAGLITSPAQATTASKAPTVKFDKRPSLSKSKSRTAAKRTAEQDVSTMHQAVTENIVINIYAGAMDPYEIAKVVKQELDRRDMNRRSAQRSAYVDYGA